MSKNNQTGAVLVPLLIVAAIVVGALLTYVVLQNVAPVPTNSTSTRLPETVAPAPTTEHPRLVWSNFGDNRAVGVAPAGGQAVQVISVGPAKNLQIAVTVSAGNPTVTLRDPDGQPVTVSPTLTRDPKTNAVTARFNIGDNKLSGDWQATIGNPNPTTTLNYTVTVPQGATPLDVSPQISGIVATNQSIVVSLAVQETVHNNPQPLTGAVVTATVTDPNKQSTTLTLQEINPTTNPGVYSGTFTGDQTPGTYQVGYVINGQTSTGDQFTQTTSGQFIVATSATSTIINYTKKYDINRGNEVQIIGY